MKLSVEFVPYILEQRAREIIEFTPKPEGESDHVRLAILHEVIEVITSYTTPSTEVTWLATMSFRKIKGLLKDNDPYRMIKDEEVSIAKKLFNKYVKGRIEKAGSIEEKLEILLKASVITNLMNPLCDYSIEKVENELANITTFKVKGLNVKSLMDNIAGAKIAFIPDGVGEFLFDNALIACIAEDLSARVRVYIKTGAYMDDLTYNDALKYYTPPENTQFVPIETDAAGIDKSLMSKMEIEDISSNDVIIAKGVMNYCGLKNGVIKKPSYILLRSEAASLSKSLGLKRWEAAILKL